MHHMCCFTRVTRIERNMSLKYVAALNKMEESQRKKGLCVWGYEYLREVCGGRWQDVMKRRRVRWRGRRGLWRIVPRQPCEWMKGGRGHVWVERRDSPAAETDAMLVRLHFPPPNTTEHANLESVSLWTSQPVNLHQTRCAVTLSWWVPPSLLCSFAFFHCFSFFWNLCSRAQSPLQQKEEKKKSHVRKREKESESETCEMKKEQRDIWLSVALLAVADVIRRDYRNTILTQITSPPLRLTAVSLSASRVGHPAVISTAGTPRDFSVYFLSVNHLYSSHSSPGVM